MYLLHLLFIGMPEKTCRICEKPFLGKNKKMTGNLGRDQDKRASSQTERNVQNYTFEIKVLVPTLKTE